MEIILYITIYSTRKKKNVGFMDDAALELGLEGQEQWGTEQAGKQKNPKWFCNHTTGSGSCTRNFHRPRKALV